MRPPFPVVSFVKQAETGMETWYVCLDCRCEYGVRAGRVIRCPECGSKERDRLLDSLTGGDGMSDLRAMAEQVYETADDIARDYDQYENGLPHDDEHKGRILDAIVSAFGPIVRTLEADLRRAVEDRAKLREAMHAAAERLTDMSKLDAPAPWACQDIADNLLSTLADLDRPTPQAGE